MSSHPQTVKEPSPPLRPTRIHCLGNEENLARIQREISVRVAALGYSGWDAFAIELALEEALRNAVTHGHGGDPAKCLKVNYLVSEFGAWIRVEDEGPGFRPDQLADPARDDNLDRPHGRGVFLMHRLMDNVYFNRQGNAVTLELVRQSQRRRL